MIVGTTGQVFMPGLGECGCYLVFFGQVTDKLGCEIFHDEPDSLVLILIPRSVQFEIFEQQDEFF